MTVSERSNSKEALIIFILRRRVAFLRAVFKQKLLDLMKSLGPCILAFNYRILQEGRFVYLDMPAAGFLRLEGLYF